MLPIAMILAAGVGSRLQPLTDKTPKALLHFRGKPMLEHVIMKLKSHGITEVVINIHHHAQQIVEFVQMHNDFGMNIYFSNEKERLMDTGGAILKARGLLEGRGSFLVHNVDIFTDLDIKALYHSHLAGESLATLAVQDRKTSRNLLIDRRGWLCGWRDNESGKTVMAGEEFLQQTEKRSNNTEFDGAVKADKELFPVAFSGIHVVNPQIFKLLGFNDPFSIIHAYLKLCAEHKIDIYDHSPDLWIDMANKESIQMYNKY